MRIDRYLTLGVFRPLKRAGAVRRSLNLPILMYHSISAAEERDVNPYYRVATSPQRFADQMLWLSELGCAGCSLEDALISNGNKVENGRRPVAITFDDGYRDFYTEAWPRLQNRGFTATMHLPTAFIAERRKSFYGRECLTWNEARELRAHGIRFGSHTVNHPKLHGLPWKMIRSELTGSKECLENELGESIHSFAYPYAFPQEDRRFTETFAALLREADYRTCVTTVVGRMPTGGDPLYLKRLPINSCDDRLLFESKLDGAYDWLGATQNAFRHLKRWSGPLVAAKNNPLESA